MRHDTAGKSAICMCRVMRRKITRHSGRSLEHLAALPASWLPKTRHQATSPAPGGHALASAEPPAHTIADLGVDVAPIDDIIDAVWTLSLGAAFVSPVACPEVASRYQQVLAASVRLSAPRLCGDWSIGLCLYSGEGSARLAFYGHCNTACRSKGQTSFSRKS